MEVARKWSLCWSEMRSFTCRH